MTRIVMTVLTIALMTLLAACGWSGPGSLDRAAADAGSTAAVQHDAGVARGPAPLPPGHPPVGRGHGVLPPGHPPIPDGLTCPGLGAGREPAGDRFRVPGTDAREIISI